MPEMEKGRPPENKRSRKPAHPVKREVNQEMKSFAESTVNELLGWYGYERMELRDVEASDVKSHAAQTGPQHVSVLKENSVPKLRAAENKVLSPSLPLRNGERETASVPLSSSSSSSSSPGMKEPRSTHVIVPLIKPSAVEDVQIQIVCVWCQREGLKRFSLIMGSELKSFCSEKCFAACRRAYFKRNKARDEDHHGNQSPPPGQTVDTPPRLVLKMNSNARACDWCKHVHHAREYLDFSAGEERLRFCSTKCLNRYKMDVFYREAQAALAGSETGANPGQGEEENHVPVGGTAGEQLLTPESWESPSLDKGNKPVPPETSTPISDRASICLSPPVAHASPSSLSSSSVKVSVCWPTPRERPPHRETTPSQTGGVSEPRPRPGVDRQHRPHPPLLPLPTIRPPLHAQGLRSPAFNSGHNTAPPTSPTRIQPSPAPRQPPPLIQPAYHTPFLTYPQPTPPVLLGLGVPSFAPPCPQPTVLVPYPVIVPFPVPVPIPVPLPLPLPTATRSSASTGARRGFEEKREELGAGSNDEEIEHRVKMERLASPSPPSVICVSGQPVPAVTENATGHGQREDRMERNVIQRVGHGQPVKNEGVTQTGPDPLGQREGVSRSGSEDTLEPRAQQTNPNPSNLTHTPPPHSTHTAPIVPYTPASDITHTTLAPSEQTSAKSPNTHITVAQRKSPNQSKTAAASVVTPTVSRLLDNTAVTPAASVPLVDLNATQATSASCEGLQGVTSTLDMQGGSSSKSATPLDFALTKSEDVEENSVLGNESPHVTQCRTERWNQKEDWTEGEEGLTADEDHAYARIVLRNTRMLALYKVVSVFLQGQRSITVIPALSLNSDALKVIACLLEWYDPVRIKPVIMFNWWIIQWSSATDATDFDIFTDTTAFYRDRDCEEQYCDVSGRSDVDFSIVCPRRSDQTSKHMWVLQTAHRDQNAA
ncbi:sine oculis-binding protein homolog B [Chanos chanos]|uniref:Sine oculis-binding protein homolog B n=1 Tax=Chanos chanos TaxID=29144 RepID=A0A6J2W078_CHACN|nr:sine oculis-binding protein homolog [Chanos chanos]